MSGMSPRERFLAALRRQAVDRVPMFDFLFQRPLFTGVIGRTPANYNARDAMDLTVALGLDGVWIPYGCFSGWAPEKLSKNVYVDEWGTTFEQNETSWPIDAPIAFPLTDSEDLAAYRPPDSSAEGRMDEIDTAIAMNRELGDRAVAIMGGVGGPFTVSWMLTGYENICMKLFDDPGFLEQIAQYAVDFAVTGIERMAEGGVDGMVVSEDLGSSCGGLISPDHFRQIFKPKLGEIIDCAKAHSLPVLLHSCGRVYDYIDDLIELGIDALHPLQRTAGMDLAKVKADYGDKICIVGNIDSSVTLPYGTTEDVEEETRNALEVGAPNHGYILASDHSLHDGIPVENILRMFQIGKDCGGYNCGA